MALKSAEHINLAVFGFSFREETRILSSDIKLLKRKDFHG